MAEDQKETLAAWAPRALRVLRGNLGKLDPWEKGGRLACEASQASKVRRAVLELEAQEDSQAPKGMWGPQGQRGPQGLQDQRGLRENRGLRGRRVHQASGDPWDLRVNQGSRVPLAFLGPQAHQEVRFTTEEGPQFQILPHRMPGRGLRAVSSQKASHTDSCVPLIPKGVATRPALHIWAPH